MDQITWTRVQKRFWGNGRPITSMEQVTLSVRAGEFLAVVGPSDCGRTTGSEALWPRGVHG